MQMARSTSTTARQAPKGKEKNWVQTIPGQGWWVYLRFYAPTKAYFDKSWSMGDFRKGEVAWSYE